LFQIKKPTKFYLKIVVALTKVKALGLFILVHIYKVLWYSQANYKEKPFMIKENSHGVILWVQALATNYFPRLSNIRVNSTPFFLYICSSFLEHSFGEYVKFFLNIIDKSEITTFLLASTRKWLSIDITTMKPKVKCKKSLKTL